MAAPRMKKHKIVSSWLDPPPLVLVVKISRIFNCHHPWKRKRKKGTLIYLHKFLETLAAFSKWTMALLGVCSSKPWLESLVRETWEVYKNQSVHLWSNQVLWKGLPDDIIQINLYGSKIQTGLNYLLDLYVCARIQ